MIENLSSNENFDPATLLESLVVLRNLSTSNDVRDIIAAEGGGECILKILHVTVGDVSVPNADLVTTEVAILKNLALSPSLPTRLGKEGAFSAVMKVMGVLWQNRKILEESCSLLTNLIHHHADNLSIAGSHGIFEEISRLLRDVPSEESVLLPLINLIQTCLMNEESRTKLGNLDLIPNLIVLLRTLPDSLDVTISTLGTHLVTSIFKNLNPFTGALTNATLGHELNKERVGECGGIAEILTTMKRHADQESVVTSAFFTLRNVSASEANKIRIREIGGIPSIFELFCRHSTSFDVVSVAFAAMYNISINEKNARLFAELGAVPVIEKASQIHGGSVESLGKSLLELLVEA